MRTFRFATFITLGVNSYLVLVYWVLVPLHSAGIAQPVTGFLNGIGQCLSMPGLAMVIRAEGKLGHATAAYSRPLVLLLNIVIYFSIAWLLGALRSWSPKRAVMTAASSPSSAIVSRRRFLRTGSSFVALGAAAGFGYSLCFEPRWVSVARRYFPVRGLPPSLVGLKVAQLTDIHLGPWISLGFVEEVIRKTNQLDPDLILLTGDYVHQSARYIAPVVNALKELKARIGIVGVLGNHDWWESAKLVRSAFERVGLPLIDNARLFLSPDRKLVGESSEGLCIAGVGDLWEDHCLYEKALGGVPEAMPRLLLSHNPDVAEEPGLVDGGYRVDLMLSGHTHGGQIWLPGLGTPVVPSRFGQKYAHGLVQGPVCPVLISSGIGMTVLPLRFGVAPEIVVIELRQVA